MMKYRYGVHSVAFGFKSRQADTIVDNTQNNSGTLNVLTIGGGSGHFALLSGLRDMNHINITAVVSMVDSGGSTGRLRNEFGILPPGDILKCVLALSPHQRFASKVLQKRFKTDPRLMGHSAGNMLLAMLSRYTGSFPSAVAALSDILDAKGTILPVTIDPATLVAELNDGTRIFGEQAIDIPRENQREKIRDLFLVPHSANAIHVYPPVVEGIAAADYIVIGPGDLFTSILPNLIVPDVKEAIRNTNARLIYILNIMTKYGETHNFEASDFLESLEKFTGRTIDEVIYNNTPPPDEVLQKYKEQRSEYVMLDCNDSFWSQRTLRGGNLLDIDSAVIRHSSAKLTQLLQSIFFGDF